MTPDETSLLEKHAGAPAGWARLAHEYQPRIRAELTDSIVPFWRRTLDERHGGVFNCWNNAGTKFVSRDKFTWSQGRFLWLWSRLAAVSEQGLLPGRSEDFLRHARLTLELLRQHAFLDSGRCAFLLSENGEPKEPAAGLGLAPSIYADCFVAMGFAEFARVARDPAVLEEAWALLNRIEARIERGDCPTHPTPIPAGHQAYALAMIFLNVTLVVRAACDDLGSPHATTAAAKTITAAEKTIGVFLRKGGRIAEFRTLDGEEPDTMICRHVNPGHALEGAWMLLEAGVQAGRADWIGRANEAVRFALQVGWDSVHGGMLHYVDREGGAPRGDMGVTPYETAVRKNWDAKLWWVHSEAIYASLLSYRLTGDEETRAGFEHVLNYALRVFPQPDPAIGE